MQLMQLAVPGMVDPTAKILLDVTQSLISYLLHDLSFLFRIIAGVDNKEVQCSSPLLRRSHLLV